MSNAHRVRIMGRELQVKSAASEEAVRKVESLVQQRVAEVESAVRGGGKEIVAILTMMNLAEAYLEKTGVHDELRQRTDERLARLIHRLDEVLA